ncbi:di-heme oxidoredictase family protein [Tenacibaculum sp. UWU-22]|uniref:di-heme oxidoreductase family protein n=1 Tax=Tenacibaculum sp. UWU-22 TaxID=3234187 RepID=UPI0034DB5EDD
MSKKTVYYCLLSILLILTACSKETSYTSLINTDRAKSGGETTIFTMSNIAYSSPAENLSQETLEKHLNGDLDFERIFVTAPATLNPGLGSVYNNSSCIKCHPSDGRGKLLPKNINGFTSLLLRISTPGNDKHNAPLAAPGYGTQLQNHALSGFLPEVTYQLSLQEQIELLADGTQVVLRKPIFSVTDWYKEKPTNYMLSPRIAPPIFGSGLLEAIPEADILKATDENDSDKNGISGKANYVWNPVTQQTELGRFGWKANVSTLQVQVAGAYHGDMGITNPVFTKEEYDDGLADDPEISAEILNNVVVYCQTLGVPAARDVDNEQVDNGYQIFQNIQCAACHTPQQRTLQASVEALSNQTFYPFTDMLLHDMGEGLADNRPDFLASGKEWQTRPLWGIGLQKIVNGHTQFLHDGRARNLTEAILWHGGEAEAAKNNFKKLSTKEREDLLAFLNSL